MTRKEKRKQFGSWLKKVRENASLTQADLAKAMSYDNPQIISNIERGVSALPTKRISEFAEALKCDPVELEFRWLAASAQIEETAEACSLALKYLPAMRMFEQQAPSEQQVLALVQKMRMAHSAAAHPSNL